MKKIIISIIVIGMFLTTIPIGTVGESVNEEQPANGELFNTNEENSFEFVSNDGDQFQYNFSNVSETLPKFVTGELIVKFKEDVQLVIQESTSEFLDTSISSEKSKNDGMDVENTLGALFSTGIESIDRLNNQYRAISIKELFPGTIVTSLSNVYKFTFPVNTNIVELMNDYNCNDNVFYAEPNYLYTTSYAQPVQPKLIPNDTYIFEKWGIHNTAQYKMYLDFESMNFKADADIDAPEAWSIETGDPNVVIAIVDTGVDYNHPDLAANIWHDPIHGNPGYDFVDIDFSEYGQWGFTQCPDEDYINPDPDPIDVHSHGTHCAGIAGAVSNNSLGVAGVSWNCKIMPVRNGFKIEYGGNIFGTMENDDSAFAILYATYNGADVISMSWGGYYPSQLIEDALDYAYSQGVVLVAAAGNDNSTAKHYPSSYDNVISVAATSPDDTKAIFSSYGETVDVCAPGWRVLSTVPTNLTGYYGSFSSLIIDSEKINSRPLYGSSLGTVSGDIVNVGKATTQELEGINLNGKISLIEKDDKYWMVFRQIERVYNKGSTGAIFFNSLSGSFWTYILGGGSAIPAVSIPREDALDIIQELGQGKTVTADLNVYKDAYQYYSGTSMASPYFAGVAALLISKNQQCPYPAQMVKSMLPFISDRINTGYDIGSGRINAFKALNQKPFASALDPADNWEDVKGTIDIMGAAWGENFQYYVLEDGLGENPSSWTTLKTSTTPQGGVLLSLNTKLKSEGLHTIRLKLVCSYGTFTDKIQIYVNNKADEVNGYDLYVSNCYNENTPGFYETRFPNINGALNKAWTAKSVDTIFVCDGIYDQELYQLTIFGSIKEGVLVWFESSISLIGQSKDWTIIDDTVLISLSSKITIEGFNIRRPLIIEKSSGCQISQNKFEVTNDLEYAITLKLSSNNNIEGNTFKGLSYPLLTGGVLIQRSSGNTVSDNHFSDFDTAVCIIWLTSSGNTVSDNTINGFYLTLPGPWGWASLSNIGSYGIDLRLCRNNIVNNNIMKRHIIGISLDSSLQNEITRNYVSELSVGVWFWDSSSFNKIVANDITADDLSICITPFGAKGTNYNKMYYNNIHDGYPWDEHLNNGTNVWYKEKLFGKDMGNYYFDYERVIRDRVGEEPKDENNDGIWDIPFPLPPYNNIEECNKDLYPVVSPFDIENIDLSNLGMSEDLTSEEIDYLAQIEQTIENQIVSGELNINEIINPYMIILSETISQSQQSSQQGSTQQSTTGSSTTSK